MDRILREIMVDTGIELDRQMLLTYDGCLVTRSNNPNNNATMVDYHIWIYCIILVLGWLQLRQHILFVY